MPRQFAFQETAEINSTYPYAKVATMAACRWIDEDRLAVAID